MTKAEIISKVCCALSSGDTKQSASIITEEYPHKPSNTTVRFYSAFEATKIFMRDCFIDRYSGARLIFPPVLRLISVMMPAEFPYHPNWKMNQAHQAYWELFPTLDHVIPIARGGADNDDNLVTTSMLRNSAKANWTLDELGWTLLPSGNLQNWNGLMHWFKDYVSRDRSILKQRYFQHWFAAAQMAERRR